MKKLLVAAAAILLAVGGAVVWFIQLDPEPGARSFLEQVAAQEFASLDSYFSAEEGPGAGELSQAFQEFAQAFALTEISTGDLELISKNSKGALFRFQLSYKSADFEALTVEGTLTATRTSIFQPWQLEWQDNLPLPYYGLQAGYFRTRQEPIRGRIVDSRGLVLAGEGSRVTVGVQPDRITSPEWLLGELERVLELSPDYVVSRYEAPGVQGHWFVPLINLTEEEYARVDPILRPIPGIFFRRVEARAYPLGSAAGQITGYLGEVTAQMLEAYPEREYLSGEIVGRAGLENSRDDALRGRPGHRFYVQPENGDAVLLRDKPVVQGADLELTLDAGWQELAVEVLGERAGALVVLNAETGAILALASTPGYDPNEFVGGISAARWQELSSDPLNPMFNRALQGLYPPGSVLKVLTVAAALEEGLYESDSTFMDSGELSVQGNIIRNFQRQVYGEHTLHQAVVESINTTIAQVGLDLGPAKLQEYFQKLKLDQAHRLGLPMSQGQVGTPGRSRVALAWSAIGQDQVLLTPFHLAQLFAAFANDGVLPPVHLVQDEGEEPGERVFQAETVERINAMLRDVVLTGTGTAAQVPGLEVYGKTGTAEAPGGVVHAWFAGHTQLPAGEKLAFALLVENGGVGGQAAAPLVGQFLQGLLR